MSKLALILTPALVVLPLLTLAVLDRASAAPEAPAADPAKPAAPAKAAAKTPGPLELAWKDMSAEQKTKYMKVVVTPKMKVLFQEFDGAEFKKFGCDTCHGKDPKANKFKMPSADVHPLPGTPAAFQEMIAKKPALGKMAKFMGETVKPQMAALLGLPEFDPKKPEAGGFGCQNCHTIGK